MGDPVTAPETEGSRLHWLVLFVVGSLLVHAVGLWLLPTHGLELFTPQRPIELVAVEIQPAPPPPPRPAPEPLKEPKVAPRPHRVAVAPKPTVRPPSEPPPPPDQPPPSKPVPQIVGLTMSSTSTAGAFAAPVGNTNMGAVGPVAKAPSEVKAGGGLTPLAEIDSGPMPLDEVRIPYPAQARTDGIEGTVTLLIVVDDTGTVTRAKVLGGPGHGVNEAALEAIRRFRFKPARRGGQAVSVETRFAYTFELY
jgi:protein TonB